MPSGRKFVEIIQMVYSVHIRMDMMSMRQQKTSKAEIHLFEMHLSLWVQ